MRRICVILGCLLVAADDAGPPRVTAVWPAGPLETRVAFDRPIGPALVEALTGAAITFDGTAPGVSATAARGSLRIAAARLADDGRTLVLTTDPHSREGWYSFPLAPTVDVRYDLSGVEAVWDDGKTSAWSGWWPELDSDAARRLTRGSVEHDRVFALLDREGRLTLNTLVRLPKGKGTLRLVANRPIVEAAVGGENVAPSAGPGGESRVELPIDAPGDPLFLNLTVRTGAGARPLALHATVRIGDAAERPLSRADFVVPWSPGPVAAPAPADVPLVLTGGDRDRGEAVFFGETAKCSTCHQVRGKGGKVGPDLTALVGHDRAEVYRAIAEPSAVVRPDFVPYTLALKDGRVLAGIVRAESAAAIRITDTNAQATIVPRADIEDLRPSNTSIMPVGLAGVIGADTLRDLIAFLTAPPPASRP